MERRTYTKELLEPLVKQSFSIAGVIRLLGIEKWSGGAHSHVSRRIKTFGIDTSHFLGQASNRGKAHRGGPQKKTWQEVLILRTSGHREKSHKLRRALIESGVPYVCAGCGLGPEWEGKELTLQADHKNGNFLDDRRENLCFRCPNCHSQTEGWCGRDGHVAER